MSREICVSNYKRFNTLHNCVVIEIWSRIVEDCNLSRCSKIGQNCGGVWKIWIDVFDVLPAVRKNIERKFWFRLDVLDWLIVHPINRNIPSL